MFLPRSAWSNIRPFPLATELFLRRVSIVVLAVPDKMRFPRFACKRPSPWRQTQPETQQGPSPAARAGRLLRLCGTSRVLMLVVRSGFLVFVFQRNVPKRISSGAQTPCCSGREDPAGWGALHVPTSPPQLHSPGFSFLHKQPLGVLSAVHPACKPSPPQVRAPPDTSHAAGRRKNKTGNENGGR